LRGIALATIEDMIIAPKVTFWHRELPPVDAEPVGDHTLEAVSRRIPDTIARRDELWNACHEELMAHARERLEQEVARLGGRYAHVLDETIEPKHDPITGEAWLHGRFTYVLYG
jgi:hypothetical protein